jgi:hypothetical protein
MVFKMSTEGYLAFLFLTNKNQIFYSEDVPYKGKAGLIPKEKFYGSYC